MIRFWTSLGLFSELRPYNTVDHDNRYMRASLIDSFGSQFVAVLLKTDQSYQLLTLVQGHPVKISGCSSNPCPIDEFFSTYSKLVEESILRKICPEVVESSKFCATIDDCEEYFDSDSD